MPPPTENAFSREQLDERVVHETRSPAARPDPARTSTRRASELRPEQLDRLLSLSRRHDLPFGVLVVRVRDRARADGPRGVARRSTAHAERLLRLVDSEIRRTDLLATFGREDAIVFCPATPPEGIKELAERLRAVAGELPIGVGVASFRLDGLTLPDIVACANAREEASSTTMAGAPPPGVSPRLRSRGARVDSRYRMAHRIKRIFDLFMVIAAAPLWLPLTAIVALAVKVSDPRAPVVFAQDRTGRGGHRFRMYKFRTMVPDAEQRKVELRANNERSWPDFKVDADPRITRLGRRLRASSLDELPQLWNVLRGDMSLVGPRPTSFPAETYESWQTARLEVTPGLTGLWQVEARNCPDFSERIRLDLRYVENQGFLYDLRILLRTLPAVLWDREGR